MSPVNSFNIEAFTYLVISVLAIGFRAFCRLKQGGLRNLQWDDYFMIAVCFPLTTETVLAYMVGKLYLGLTNSGMTDEQRAAIIPGSEEWNMRVGGSKTQVVGWTIYTTVMWLIKASMCAFYARLTTGLSNYKIRINIGYVFIATTYIATVACILFSCHPMEKHWQIYPDPGNICQPAISKPNVYCTLFLNLFTDLYLLFIPLPMLWGTQLAPVKKFGLLVLFSGGIFIIIAGIIRCTMILNNPITGPLEAATWAIRESFIAVITSNLPITWGLIRQKLKPILGSLISSNKPSYKSGPEPGSFRLGDRSGPRTWGSNQTKNVVETETRVDNEIFIHTSEESSEQIIPGNKRSNSKIVRELKVVVTSADASHSDGELSARKHIDHF